MLEEASTTEKINEASAAVVLKTMVGNSLLIEASVFFAHYGYSKTSRTTMPSQQ
jgi:hypothetical protein